MKDLFLNDILHLNDEQIANSKIGLNMSWDGISHFTRWYESDENNRHVDFTYHSHQAGRKNFYEGELCFGFVRLEDNPNKWLLVSAGQIVNVPPKEKPGTCKHIELPQYQGLIGRLVISYHKGNKFSRYIFKLGKILNDIKVSEVLPNIYEPIKFNGFENVHLGFSTLKMILETERYQDYKAALKGIKGIYCLTDSKEGKLYIGSASGEDGILQRWSNYIDSKTGGNQALIELYNSKGDKYFQDYFEYTIIETFTKNTDIHKIIERENYWKGVFKTKENGYNRN